MRWRCVISSVLTTVITGLYGTAIHASITCLHNTLPNTCRLLMSPFFKMLVRCWSKCQNGENKSLSSSSLHLIKVV